jgi:hypothetical protein
MSIISNGRTADDDGERQATAPLDELAARIERRAARVADEISPLADRVDDPSALQADLLGEAQAFLVAVADSLRTGRGRADRALVERWRSLGRRSAGEGLGLSGLLATLRARHQVVVGCVVAECWGLPPTARTIETFLVSTTMALAAEGVMVIAEAYVDARLTHGSTARAATGDTTITPALVRHLTEAGLRPAPVYAVVALLLASSDWSVGAASKRRLALEIESSPTIVAAGAVWRTVGRIGVLVVPVTGDCGRCEAVLDTVCSVASGHVPSGRLLVAYTGPQRGPTGPRGAFELARRMLDAAERLGERGVVRLDDLLLPTLLVSAPDVARPLAELLGRIDASGRAGSLAGTLRQYLACGLSVNAAARALCIHPNTLRDRLRRVERILGRPVAGQAALLQLALLARDLGLGPGSVVATDDHRSSVP